jgi:hypothetical protein
MAASQHAYWAADTDFLLADNDVVHEELQVSHAHVRRFGHARRREWQPRVC